MKCHRILLLAAVVAGAAAITMACEAAGAGQPAAQQPTYEALAARVQRLETTLAAVIAYDTVPIPPKCPPYCAELDVLRRFRPAGPAQR